MQLSLLLGRAGYGKTSQCLNEISQRLAQNPDGHPLILIVPEQATFALEKLLAQSCPSLGFTRAYVVGFRRLAYRVLSQTGGCARPHITELGKRLAISRILLDNKDQLKILGKMPQETALAALLSELIKDFKNYGLAWEDLYNVYPQEDGAGNTSLTSLTSLKKKLSDLSLIYKNFDEFLAGRYTDPEDYIKLLAEKIPASVLIKNAEVWVDGFSWFTPQEYAALEALIKTALSVKVTLCLGDPANPVHELQESLFHNQWQTRRCLLRLAAQLNCPVGEKELKNPCRFASRPFLANIEKNFDYNLHALRRSANPSLPPASDSSAKPTAGRAFTIAEAASQTVETEIISREILRLSREEGLRFKDMAVILRDSSYRELIEVALADYDIPFFSDSTRPVMHHPLAELIRSALDIVLEKWSYEPIFRALKTDFFNISRDEADILENYALEFGLRGSRWLDARPWAFYRRYSLGEDNHLEDKEVQVQVQKQQFLAEINDIRFRATAELIEFSGKLSRNLPVEVFAQALYELAVRLDVPGVLDKWASAAETAGDLEQAREHRQIWQEIIELLDQLVETFKGQTLTLEAFAALIGEGLNSLSLSLIPPGLDYVTIADVKRTKLFQIKAAFVPGVNDGVFPARYQDTGLINDSEREFLRAAGVELPGGITSDLFGEKFLVYTALTSAAEYLWVSYALADAEGKAMLPSFVIKRLKEISGATEKYYPPQPPPGREAEYISTPAKTMSLLAAVFRSYQETKTINPLWCDVYNWALANGDGRAMPSNFLAGLFHANKAETMDKELTRALFCPHKPVLRGSVTRFESFSACPFQHFAKYGLRLKERPVYQLSAPDLGQFLHAVMKNFGVKVRESGQKWAELTHEQAGAWSSQIASELAPALQNEILTSSAQYEHLLKNLGEKAARSICRLIDFAQKSRFEPLALEQSFGRGGDSLPPLPFGLPGGSRLEVSGQIDRIDALEYNGKMYALIIDYKSGGAALSLNEVFHGLKLQLMTYLLAVAGGGVLPAGAVYCYLKNPVITAKNLLPPEKIAAKINSALKMPGWLLADWEIIKMLDGSLPGYSDFFRIGASNNGGFYETSLNQLKSPAEFEALLALTAERLQTVGERILAGETAIYPARLKNRAPCTYCNYQAVCQFDRYLEGNNYNILPNLDDKDIWAKILK